MSSHDIQLDFPESLKQVAAEREDMLLAVIASYPHSKNYRLAFGCIPPMQIVEIIDAVNAGKKIQIMIVE